MAYVTLVPTRPALGSNAFPVWQQVVLGLFAVGGVVILVDQHLKSQADREAKSSRRTAALAQAHLANPRRRRHSRRRR
jgi:hypothetical protein